MEQIIEGLLAFLLLSIRVIKASEYNEPLSSINCFVKSKFSVCANASNHSYISMKFCKSSSTLNVTVRSLYFILFPARGIFKYGVDCNAISIFFPGMLIA